MHIPLAYASSILFIKLMDTAVQREALHVRIIKILGLYVLPSIIFALLMVLLFVPVSKKPTAAQIDAQIKALEAQKTELLRTRNFSRKTLLSNYRKEGWQSGLTHRT
jgi:hypothetical protein